MQYCVSSFAAGYQRTGIHRRPLGGTLEHDWCSRTTVFRTAYPKTLLRSLAIQAKLSFEALGLKPYMLNEQSIADLLNEAWKHFQSHPESFARYGEGSD